MDLLNAYARCVRIVRDQETRHTVDPERFTEEASTALYEALGQVQSTISEHPPEESPAVDEVLRAIQTLVPAINAFFDDVLVMAADPSLRHNRLGLVQDITSLTEGVADLAKMEGF
jgi:glycyl-tRNA synthetase beta subunit